MNTEQLKKKIENAENELKLAKEELAKLQAEPPKFDLKKFESGEQVVNCQTEQEAREFCAWMHFVLGKKWHSGENYLRAIHWGICGPTTCYAARGIYNDIKYFESHNKQIIPYTPEIIEIRPEVDVVDMAKKVRKYCRSRDCDGCPFNPFGCCAFVSENPDVWDLPEVE